MMARSPPAADQARAGSSPGVPRLQRRCHCGTGGRCAACEDSKMRGLQARLQISEPGDRYEQEAERAARQVMQGRGVPPVLSRLAAPPLQRQDGGRAHEADPVVDGLGIVADNLSENNPAFGEFTDRLAQRFLSQPPALSVGVPVFLGANYAFLWGLALVDPAMRRHFDDFNLAMLPGIVPQFPIKTFTYRILDAEQTRFEFDVGLDASALIEAFNEGVLDTQISKLTFESSGQLDTAGAASLSLSALQVNLGLFGDGITLSGGFRQGVSPYPLFEHDPASGETSRVEAQIPALPDLLPGQRDVRFFVQLDVGRLIDHFGGAERQRVPAPGPADTGVARAALDQAGAATPAAAAAGAVHATLATGGAALDRDTRRFMEARFGHDFGAVRVHADAHAGASAQAVAARAYTVGPHVVFGPGQYAPGSSAGRALLAHELAHVVQQQGAAPAALQRVPDAEGIEDSPPRYAYSTYCGWIDWSHAQPGLMRRLIARVRAASERLAASPGAPPETLTGPRMESAPGDVLLSGATPRANINRALSEEEILSVALRIFMDQSQTFEGLQAWTDWVGESSFSEEDLASNLIGFYRAARGYGRDDINSICDAWNAADSLALLETYEFQRQHDFPGDSWWPAELNDIQPAAAHGELMDMVSMLSETLFGATQREDLLGPELIADPALHIAALGGGNPIDISSDQSGAEGAPTFEVRTLRPGHELRFRWGLRDADDQPYAMWSEGGQVHQYGSQSRAYIGSRTRALLRERGIRNCTVRCRLRSGAVERLLTFEAQFTW